MSIAGADRHIAHFASYSHWRRRIRFSSISQVSGVSVVSQLALCITAPCEISKWTMPLCNAASHDNNSGLDAFKGALFICGATCTCITNAYVHLPHTACTPHLQHKRLLPPAAPSSPRPQVKAEPAESVDKPRLMPLIGSVNVPLTCAPSCPSTLLPLRHAVKKWRTH